ncbi:DUF2589 domain-containing protein [Aliivibrio fischeri]|uniref:DUF2589 domain-containing protein n=2 Tax=Aliivibrio fischeri TaxID=668 RepID=A0A510UCN1_ALIFS|nr:DUF2589 domain-containing protein [Aliivibrio fischeri]MUK29120.1 DUF2589 domain-containing protein [Aliivibrio fischeri]MUK48256.1 DUF2589 domain-containing protein [Aliivibrio fischeri]MUK64203.1 DUF2589 domain-containing protein [Aliivibrio fischeri]GEK12344.1 hypothetical protein AFI02nite_03800 [Aliivibrio fischeri]
MNIFGRKNKPISPQFLDGIIRGLNYVANSASDMNLSHYQNLISQYFDYDEEKCTYKPKTIKLMLDDEHEITMPLIAVTDAKGLYLDELGVDFSVRVTGVDTDNLQQDFKATYPKLIVDISPSHRNKGEINKDFIDFKVKFKSSDAPECVMKIIDKFNTQIIPKKIVSDSSSEMTPPEVNTSH